MSAYCTRTAGMFQRAETFLWPLELQLYSGMIAALPVVLIHEAHQWISKASSLDRCNREEYYNGCEF
jgi:hypothetical protein